MKLILTTLIAALLVQTVHAQSFSLGARTGLGKTFDVTQIKNGSISNTWDKELFFRYETKGKIAIEGSGTQYKYGYNFGPFISGCAPMIPPTGEDLGGSMNYNMIDLSISFQYNIICPDMQESYPVLKNLKSFLGLSTGVAFEQTTMTNTSKQYSDGQIIDDVAKGRGFANPQLGINHIMTYSFKQVYLTTAAAYTIQPWNIGVYNFNADGFVNNKLSLRIGLGYRL